MSEKLIPKNPEEVMVIRDVSPNVTTLSVPFLRFGKVKFGGRATIVRLSSGSLAVFSPVALTPTVKTKVQSLGGKVAYIAAPDLEHHIFLSDWATAFPEAHLIAPEGLAEKRASQSASNPRVTILDFQTIFSAATKAQQRVSDEFDRDFEYEFVDAHPNKEIVFFYKPDATLIQADLLFNMPATEQYSRTGEDAAAGWINKLFCGLQNTRGDALWQKRMLWYGFSAKDRTGFNASIQRIAQWPFKDIVPCHGDVMQGDGEQIFKKVMAWHIAGLKK
ncbi:hypothetical protein PVAG01_09100 [Phlyctema vagabunda]|uniref:DUF4336 domain-containing protein n=1 Tax=Phlyctema vagabunda TaxID=108571 RepID=A0ABR4P6E0_9HELO